MRKLVIVALSAMCVAGTASIATAQGGGRTGGGGGFNAMTAINRWLTTPDTIKVWRRAGLLRCHAYNDKGQHLYEPPGGDAPVRKTWKGISAKKRLRKVAADATEEVQYEA